MIILKLTRNDSTANGIFGVLSDEDGTELAVTLEHAYDSGHGNGSFVPKVASGTYLCQRHAPNRLPYETFELQDVPNFEDKPVTGILIHKGNFDKDSDGCILLGTARNGDMITSSAPIFNKFMTSLTGIQEFQLVIS
jgi:hypothetical protein